MSYHIDLEYLSKSFLFQFEKSPLQAYTYLHGEKKDTPAMQFGRVYHSYIAGEKSFIIFDESQRPEQDKTMASNANKAWKAEFYATDKDVIDIDDFNKILVMRDMLEKNSIVQQINAFQLMQEETFKATVEGRKIKCKPDGLQIGRGKNGENLIIDWKTCNDITPYAVTYAFRDYGYGVQAAIYSDIITNINGGETNFMFIFQEKFAPYDVLPVLVKADSETMQSGRVKYQRYYDQAQECLKTGIWSGISSKFDQQVMIME